MGALQQFERRLEGAVEGFFARAFRSGVQPIELAKAVQRYAADQQHVTSDGVVVPNVYRVTVSPKDHARLAGYGASLPRELAELVVSTAADRDWRLRGPVKVRIEVDDDVRLGRYRVAGRVEAVGANGRATASPAATPASGTPASGMPASGTPLAAGAGAAGNRAGSGHGAPGPSDAPRATPRQDHRAEIERTQIVGTIPAADFAVVVRSGPAAGARVDVRGQRITVGRQHSCDLVVDDSTVSREHVALVRRGAAWWVVDLGSTNGTTVNGTRAAEHPVGVGDRIQLGDAVLELVEA